MIRLCTLLACVCFVCVGRSFAAEPDWRPESTWVFAVGVLEWEHPEIWRAQPGAVENRRDVELVRYFKDRSVPDDHIVYLQDKQATRQKIVETFDEMMRRTRKDDQLILYYTGHGFRDRQNHQVHFANYDAVDGRTAWPVKAIVRSIDRDFHGRRALLIADCCYSGGFVEELNRGGLKKGYGCLCSSFSRNSSTGAWTFTETLLKGLKGEPVCDLDADGAVEFSELAQYADGEMVFVENQKSQSGRTGNFPDSWKISLATEKTKPRVGERLEVEWNGEWYKAEIMDTRTDEFKVHYVHFDASWDEWVKAARMRPYRPKNLVIGTRVQVLWPQDNNWYAAKVLASSSGLHFVHYDGYSAEWDAWVTLDMIRTTARK